MPNSTTDPNMGFQNATPGVDPGIPTAPPGQDYATLTSQALTTIGAHGHTGAPNDGKNIVTAAININGDLTFNSYNATNLRTTRYINQSAALSGSSDVLCLYPINNNLYYNNASGIPVQLTNGSSIASSGGSNLIYNYLAVTSNHTILSTDSFTYFDSNAGVTFMLPLASAMAAGTYYIIKDKSGTAASSNIIINVATGSGNFIDGNSSYTITTNYGCVVLITDGVSNWRVESLQVNGGNITAASIPVNKLTPGTSAQVLLNSSGPTATWTTLTGDVTVSNAGATTVNKIQGITISATPADTYLLVASSNSAAAWTAVTGDIVSGSPGFFNVQGCRGNNFSFATSTVSTTASLNAASLVVFASSASGEIFLTLPAIFFGRTVMIKDYTGHAGTNNIVISGATGDIDGAASYTLNQNYASAIFCSDGSNWFVMAAKGT